MAVDLFPSRTGKPHRDYPDPFDTQASLMMPRTVEELMRLCEKIWNRNGTYSRACKRIVSYFLTSVEVADASDDEKKRYEKFLNIDLDLKNILAILGYDFLCYGNSFSSIYVPFIRTLTCSKCRTSAQIEFLENVEFNATKVRFQWNCRICGHKCCEKPSDRRLPDETKIHVKRWSPHEIKILNHKVSGRRTYLWNPLPRDIQQVKAGNMYILRDMPWEMVETLCAGKMFEFGKGVIFHIADEPLAGIDTGGWGLPGTLQTFAQAYYVQLGKLYNETLFQEYIVPMRLLSPAPGNVPGRDPMLGQNLGQFNTAVRRMFNDHRRNPGGLFTLPIPVNYQPIGGEGVQINTYDHIAAATDEMLNAIGVPVELYKGSLSLQTAPTAMRLFESTWPHLISGFNKWLDWLMQNLADVFRWDRASATLKNVTWADDMERRQILLQLMAANKVSTDTVLAPLGINAINEIKKVLDERAQQMDAENEFNLEQQRKQMMQQLEQSPVANAAGAAAGMPPGGGQPGQGNTTMDDIMAQAQQTAQQLLNMPYENRRRELNKIKKASPTLHALVKAQLEEGRNAAASQGQQMVLQQQAQQAGQQV